MEQPLQNERVVVVEDEIFIALALQRYLIKAGAVSVEIATSLKDAADLLQAGSFTAAVLDIRLPDGPSFELAERLMKRDISVTFHSGQADKADKDLHPYASFCPKPSTLQDMVTAILEAKVLLSEQKAR